MLLMGMAILACSIDCYNRFMNRISTIHGLQCNISLFKQLNENWKLLNNGGLRLLPV